MRWCPKVTRFELINEVIDKVDLSILTDQYKGGGIDYHPKMLLKILVYVLSNIYSSRKLEAAVRGSVYLMWLSGMTYRTPYYQSFQKRAAEGIF